MDRTVRGDRLPAAGAHRRAGRWATAQVGRHGRTVSEVARDLGCDWHTVNDAVVAYGRLLVDDPARIGQVTALGLDEVLFGRRGKWRTKQWSTSIEDVRAGMLLDVVEGRDAAPACRWLADRGPAWRANITYASLDLSGPYRKVYDTMLPDAVQVADPFHVTRLASSKLDQVRRRIQQETLGHRGRKHDPLYRARKLLVLAQERLQDRGRAKLAGLLNAGARVTNGPTESMNNLIKRIKRVAFGMTNFRNWRIRVLLYAGRPDWSRLATVTP